MLQIQENPYLQYFAGFSRYGDEQPFAPSLFVDIRKRKGADAFACFERVILEKIRMPQKSQEGSPSHEVDEAPENKGKLVVDTTVAEQAIRYPTDISLLNEAREISENLIDELYPLSEYSRKPRTY